MSSSSEMRLLRDLEKKPIDPEGAFLSEAIQVIKAINARTAVLIAEYEHIRKAMGQTDEAKST